MKVHLLWVKGDGPASQKTGGFVGAKGKVVCRFCNVEGHKCPHCNSYYFPSRVKVRSTATRNRTRLVVCYNPEQLPFRTKEEIEQVFSRLQREGVSNAKRRMLTKSTIIKRRTFLYDISSLAPFQSFPLDVMHIFLNTTKDLIALWKGENRYLQQVGGDVDDFSIGKDEWMVINSEIEGIAKDISLQTFG